MLHVGLRVHQQFDPDCMHGHAHLFCLQKHSRTLVPEHSELLHLPLQQDKTYFLADALTSPTPRNLNLLEETEEKLSSQCS